MMNRYFQVLLSKNRKLCTCTLPMILDNYPFHFQHLFWLMFLLGEQLVCYYDHMQIDDYMPFYLSKFSLFMISCLGTVFAI